MRFAYRIDGTRVFIGEYTDNMAGTLMCPEGHPVIAKRGTIKVHHFAHKSQCACSSHDNKGEWHIRFQDRARKEYQEVRVNDGERVHIADTLVPIATNGCKGYVIEYQHSPMDTKTMRERENFYTKAGYHLVWVFDTKMWDYRFVREWMDVGMLLANIRKLSGSDFPMNAAYTGSVTKILDFDKSELFVVTKQIGKNITGYIIDFETFDEKFLGSAVTPDADTYALKHRIKP